MKRRSGFGWLELVSGILQILLGIILFAKPELALTGLVVVYGLAAVLIGVADIVLYIQMERYLGFGPVVSLISGILSVMSGFMLMVYPGTGALVLTLLFPIWFIAHCISRLCHLDHIRLTAGRGIGTVVLILNLLGLVLGILMLFEPLFTLTVLQSFAGIYLILLGVESIAMALGGTGRRF